MLNTLDELAPIASVKPSIFRSTWLPAIALAAVLIPLCSARTEAAPIFCVSQTSESCLGDYNAGLPFQSNTWKFYRDSSYEDLIYTLEIGGRPTSNFTLDVHDIVTDQATLAGGGALANFPGAVCIPTYDGDSCGLFQVREFYGAATWEFGYRLIITWFSNDNPLSQPPNDGLNTILQAEEETGGVFANTLAEILYDPNPTPVDPAIGGRGDAFSTFGAFRFVNGGPGQPVPEPASVMLLGTALAGIVCRARYRKAG